MKLVLLNLCSSTHTRAHDKSRTRAYMKLKTIKYTFIFIYYISWLKYNYNNSKGGKSVPPCEPVPLKYCSTR